MCWNIWQFDMHMELSEQGTCEATHWNDSNDKQAKLLLMINVCWESNIN